MIYPDYEDESVTLYLGDCRLILPHIEEKSIDAVVTDPPYGMNLQPQRKKTKAIANDNRNEAKALFYGILPDLDRVAKDDTAHFVFGRWSERWAADAIAEWWTLKSCVVWKKHVFGLGYYTRPQHEFIWYCHKGKPPTPERAISDVWEFKREMRPIHSCQKPVDLCEKAIEFASCAGGVVLDPFMGVGGTALAAKRTGRKFIGIEQNEEYFLATVSRLQEESKIAA